MLKTPRDDDDPSMFILAVAGDVAPCVVCAQSLSLVIGSELCLDLPAVSIVWLRHVEHMNCRRLLTSVKLIVVVTDGYVFRRIVTLAFWVWIQKCLRLCSEGI